MADATASGVVDVTDANFESVVLKSPRPFLLDFYADWCQPCKAIAPVLSQLSVEMADRLQCGKLDIDHQKAVPTRFGVMSIPTLILFKGGRAVAQVVGSVSKSTLLNKISSHLA